ncbi:MAG: hypothetical protein LHW55_05615 [Candidatus Cloacimonetes bacterium]|nr:hypothetical protein [Candidatus Cloacimonadota bacterium]
MAFVVACAVLLILSAAPFKKGIRYFFITIPNNINSFKVLCLYISSYCQTLHFFCKYSYYFVEETAVLVKKLGLEPKQNISKNLHFTFAQKNGVNLFFLTVVGF